MNNEVPIRKGNILSRLNGISCKFVNYVASLWNKLLPLSGQSDQI